MDTVTRVLLSFLLFLLTVCPASAQTSPVQNILFIFDASGSMWGKIGNNTKIQVAKETMEKLSGTIAPTAHVGLIAYGHRREADCDDIETLLPLSVFNKAAFNATMKSLNPKGKTPIAKSINEALSVIKTGNEPVSVILISDGLETCEGNACEIVKQARADGIKITLHVVGFGITEKDLSPLECISQAGGGQYFSAGNAEELISALEQTVKETPAGDAWLSVQTTLQGKLKDATIKVYQKGVTREIALGRTYEKKETNPRILQLPAGSYDVELMPVSIEGHPGARLLDIEIKKGDTVRREIEFEQGVLELLVTRNGSLSDAVIKIVMAGTNKEVASTRSYTKPENNPAKLKIPPGVYDIIVSSVEISGKPEIRFTSRELGSAGNLKFAHNFESGELLIGAMQGQNLVDATVNIKEAKTGKSVGAGRTYQSAGTNPKSFILQPGSYIAELRPVKPAGLAAKTVNVEIQANGKTEKKLIW